MKHVPFLIIFLLFISLSGCFSYINQLEKYKAYNLEFIELIDEGLFSENEKIIISDIYQIHAPDTLKPNHFKFMLFLYKKKYHVSYLDDTANSEKVEEFTEKFNLWLEKE